MALALNPDHPPMGKPVQVLLVEDNPADVSLLEKILENSQYPVRLNVVQDGEEALAYLRHQGPYRDAPHPGLILLDLKLPRKSGHEVLEEMQRSTHLRSIPTVVLTQSKQGGDWRRAHEAHVGAYLLKPKDWFHYAGLLKYLEENWFRGIQQAMAWENPETEGEPS